jgi:hypothetical protein
MGGAQPQVAAVDIAVATSLTEDAVADPNGPSANAPLLFRAWPPVQSV